MGASEGLRQGREMIRFVFMEDRSGHQVTRGKSGVGRPVRRPLGSHR